LKTHSPFVFGTVTVLPQFTQTKTTLAQQRSPRMGIAVLPWGIVAHLSLEYLAHYSSMLGASFEVLKQPRSHIS